MASKNIWVLLLNRNRKKIPMASNQKNMVVPNFLVLCGASKYYEDQVRLRFFDLQH